ncbi:MAG: hypothetical protein J6U14_07965 [Bacteroidaceae bacterium]|nr:hypothetical protein [Bacteroidaceae bacterium]
MKNFFWLTFFVVFVCCVIGFNRHSDLTNIAQVNIRALADDIVDVQATGCKPYMNGVCTAGGYVLLNYIDYIVIDQ